MPLPFILAGVALGSQLIGDINAQNAAERAKREAIKAFEKLLIPASERERRTDRAGDTIYTRAFNELNSGAFSSRGVLNPDALKSLAFAKTATARAETEFQVGENIDAENRQIRREIAGIKATPTPTVDVAGVLGAGTAGFLGGKQIELSNELLTQQQDLLNRQRELNPTLNLGGNIPSAISVAPNDNTVTNANFSTGSDNFNPFGLPNKPVFGLDPFKRTRRPDVLRPNLFLS